MQDRPDDYKDSFYYRAIRTQIGSALRGQYDLSKPLPNRLTALLDQLRQYESADTAGDRAKPDGDAAGNTGRCNGT
jgi:hypothetical protein